MDEDIGVITCKVVLVGECSVGKTSIISRFISNTFHSELMTTPGSSCFTKKIIMKEKKQTLRFEVWDTAGQEKFRALTRIFYADASVCALVYDITRKPTFEALKNYWIQDIKENVAKDTSKSQ